MGGLCRIGKAMVSKTIGKKFPCRFESYTHRQKSMALNFFKKKKEPKNLKEVLSRFEDLKENFDKISKELESLKKENKFSIQKIGIVRFNPFKKIGGDQSFSVALLDGNDNGVVITSLYSQEGNRVYGKPIRDGQSNYLLSEEEKEAINKAKYTSGDNSRPRSNYGEKQSKFNQKTSGSSGFGAH